VRRKVLGAALAGGASARFGSPKALAMVGGRTVAARVLEALQEVTAEVVLIANEPVVAAAWPECLADDAPGHGPLGGILTALRRASEMDLDGVLCVACDMPFVSPALLRAILEEAAAHPASAVVPESNGRRSFEPLCAYYPIGALSPGREALVDGERAPHRLLERLPVRRLPRDRVELIGDPGILFFNINTREDLERAERIAAGG
jgi:molybdenum cofactor guanylyltransferase